MAPPRGQAEEQVPLQGQAVRPQRPPRDVRDQATHGKHHGKKTAIVFDVDETLLSNYTAIDADNFTFGPQSQAEATNEIGTAIEPSRDLFDLAKQKGITVFLITGRRENTRAHTTSNLTREGFTATSS